MCTTCVPGAYGGRRVLDALEREWLCTAMWVLGTELGPL